jgi:hypothetical protein
MPEPRKTRGVQMDYRQLVNPFSSKEEEDGESLLDKMEENSMILLMAEAGDKFHSLKEAKESPNWPE